MIQDLPRGAPRDAAMLLELAHTSTMGSSEFLGLYYDQITAMLIVNSHFDLFFLAWLQETVTCIFKTTFTTEKVPEECSGLRFTKQLELNSPEEVNSFVMINIGGMTVQGNEQILLLAPQFRLVRLAHYRLQAGDLKTLDGLLGCGIIMPEVRFCAQKHSQNW